MRIAFLIDWHLYYTLQLINGLGENHDILLITRDHNFEISSSENPLELDEFIDKCLTKKIAREKIRYRGRDLKNFIEVIRIYRIIKSFKPDAVHVQENTDWRIYLIAFLIGLNKVVLTLHDVVIHPGDPGKFLKELGFYFWKRVGGIIVHGNYLKEQLSLRSKRLRDKTFVIPHGAYSIYQEWNGQNVQEEKNTVLFFGRMSKYKGLNFLVEAEPLITKELPEVKIILAGRGHELDKFEAFLKTKEVFEIHNRFISNAEVPKFFRRAAVVVLPYIEASQSGVVPIAYVFGKPVVVTNVGSVSEVVDEGKTGFIVSPRDPQELAKAILKILKNREVREYMKKNALLKASTDLSWENIAKKTTEIYASI